MNHQLRGDGRGTRGAVGSARRICSGLVAFAVGIATLEACATDRTEPSEAPASSGAADSVSADEAASDPAAGLDALSAPQAATSTSCFTRQSNARLRYDFIQQSAPPAYDDATSDYVARSASYPGNGFAWASLATGKLPSSPSSASGYAFTSKLWAWSNRCIFIRGVTPSSEDCRNGGNRNGEADPPTPTVRTATATKANWYPGVVAEALPDGGVGANIYAAFSTYRKAHACTRLQVERTLGASFGALVAQSANAGTGLTLIDGRDEAVIRASVRNASVIRPVPGGTYAWTPDRFMIDACVLPSATMPDDADGIVLDHEAADWATEGEATAYLTSVANILHNHGKKLLLYTNALVDSDAAVPGAGRRNGLFPGNVRTLLSRVDQLAPVVWSGATDGNPAAHLKPHPRTWSYVDNYEAQMSFLTANGQHPLDPAEAAKVILAVALADLDAPPAGDPSAGMSEARYLHDHVRSQHLGGMMVWKNFAAVGGSCELPANQILACLAFGICTGAYNGG